MFICFHMFSYIHWILAIINRRYYCNIIRKFRWIIQWIHCLDIINHYSKHDGSQCSTLGHASINIQKFKSNTVNFNSLAPVGQKINQPVCNIWVGWYFLDFFKQNIMRESSNALLKSKEMSLTDFAPSSRLFSHMCWYFIRAIVELCPFLYADWSSPI